MGAAIIMMTSQGFILKNVIFGDRVAVCAIDMTVAKRSTVLFNYRRAGLARRDFQAGPHRNLSLPLRYIRRACLNRESCLRGPARSIPAMTPPVGVGSRATRTRFRGNCTISRLHIGTPVALVGADGA